MTQIIGRARAGLEDKKWYYTGKTCKHGHLSRRYTTNGKCYQCNREQSRSRYKLHRENCPAVEVMVMVHPDDRATIKRAARALRDSRGL